MIEWSSTMIIYIMKYTHVNGGLMIIMILFEWRMMGCWKWIVENEWFLFFSGSIQNKNRAGNWGHPQATDEPKIEAKHRAALRGGWLGRDCPSWCSWCLDIRRSSVLHPEALAKWSANEKNAGCSMWIPINWGMKFMWFPFQYLSLHEKHQCEPVQPKWFFRSSVQ